MWRRQLGMLAEAGYEGTAIDLPGHGARISDRFTIDDAIHAIDDAVHTGHSPVLLVGLSLGGYLAIEYTGRHPDRVAGMVAASCGTLSRGPGLTLYRVLAAAIHRLPDHGRWLNDRMALAFVGREATEDLIAGGVALDVMGSVLGEMSTLDQLTALSTYDGPVWFVNGRLDHFRLHERRMLRAARDGRLVVVPGATHLVSLVRETEFSAAILDAARQIDEQTG